jgi:hypothetical protein
MRLKNLSTPKNHNFKTLKFNSSTLKDTKLKQPLMPINKYHKKAMSSPNFNSTILFYSRRLLQNLRSQNIAALHAERVNQLKSEIFQAQQRIAERENQSNSADQLINTKIQ